MKNKITKQFQHVIRIALNYKIRQFGFAQLGCYIKKQSNLGAIYDNLVRMTIHTVKPENIDTILGRKLHGLYQNDMGNSFNTRIEGSRIKHKMGIRSD